MSVCSATHMSICILPHPTTLKWACIYSDPLRYTLCCVARGPDLAMWHPLCVKRFCHVCDMFNYIFWKIYTTCFRMSSVCVCRATRQLSLEFAIYSDTLPVCTFHYTFWHSTFVRVHFTLYSHTTRSCVYISLYILTSYVCMWTFPYVFWNSTYARVHFTMNSDTYICVCTCNYTYQRPAYCMCTFYSIL